MRVGLGLFVFGTLLLLAVLMLMFGTLPDWFKPVRLYTVRFTEAPGIAPGAPVRRSGVRIGTVRSIQLDEERGIVRVRIGIDPPYVIRRSEQATLVTGLLGGDASIDFVPRAEEGEPLDRTPIEPGGELVGFRSANFNTLLTRASEVVPTTQETLNDIRKSMQSLEKLATRIDKLAPVAEKTIEEYQALGKAARETIPDIQRTNTEIRELARSARQTVPTMERTADEIRELARSTRESIPAVRQAATEVGELARSARTAMPTLERTAEEIQQFSKSVRETAVEVKDLARSVRTALPTFERGADEVRELARSARQMVPSLEKTNEEVRELAKSIRDAVPDARRAVDDIAAAARYWGRVGERADRFLQDNRDNLEKAITNWNDTLDRAIRLLNDENLRGVQSVLTNLKAASDQFPTIARSADDILNQGRTTVRQLNEGLERTNKLLSDDNLKNVQTTLNNVRSASDQAPSLSRNMDEISKEGRTTVRLLNERLVQAERVMTELEKVLKPLSENGDSILKNAQESLVKLNATFDDVRALFRVLDRADGTLRKVLTDPSIYNNIDAATAMVTRLVPRLDRILKDFETFADKLARHPEAIGLGGVVRPGSGLKNPPTPPLPPGGGTHTPVPMPYQP
jgi:ABC-type transporter Mla subunit MlaD